MVRTPPVLPLDIETDAIADTMRRATVRSNIADDDNPPEQCTPEWTSIWVDDQLLGGEYEMPATDLLKKYAALCGKRLRKKRDKESGKCHELWNSQTFMAPYVNLVPGVANYLDELKSMIASWKEQCGKRIRRHDIVEPTRYVDKDDPEKIYTYREYVADVCKSDSEVLKNTELLKNKGNVPLQSFNQACQMSWANWVNNDAEWYSGRRRPLPPQKNLDGDIYEPDAIRNQRPPYDSANGVLLPVNAPTLIDVPRVNKDGKRMQSTKGVYIPGGPEVIKASARPGSTPPKSNHQLKKKIG